MRGPLSAGFLALLLIATSAQAATITVNSLDDDGNAANGNCDLREAIQAANTDAAVDGCAQGVGQDEIVFGSGVGGTIALTSALPSVTQSLTISGPGRDALTIDGGQFESIFQFNSPSNNQNFAVSDLTLTNGRGSDGGGGIFLATGETATVSRCLITKNFGDGKGHGGGIGVDGSKLTLVDSTVSDNESVVAGGGLSASSGGAQVLITGSTISGNRSVATDEGGGGGLYCETCVMTVVNSTISGNSANVTGGGIFDSGEMRLLNVTVTDNLADADSTPNTFDGIDNGGGISVAGSHTLHLKNTIVTGNADGSNETPDCDGTLTSDDYNLIGDTTGCTIDGATTHNKTGVIPLLGSLLDNGGTTFTQLLLTGSPAIDAGDPAGCSDEATQPLEKDQRGFVRPLDGDGDGTAVCDLGAVEVGCGNGVKETDEACDDGNSDDSDGCLSDCTLPSGGTTAGGTTGGTTGGTSGGSSGGCSLVRPASSGPWGRLVKAMTPEEVLSKK